MASRLDYFISRAAILAMVLLPPGISGATEQTATFKGVVNGCVEIAGHSTYRGVASLWPAKEGKAPDPRRAIRPPAASRPLDASGCFSLPAPPGDYFVGAVVRQTDGGWQGPPRPGDQVFLSPDATDRNLTVTVRSGETVSIGRHTSGWSYAGFTATGGALTISGRLTDVNGKPRQGLLVFAFTDSSMSAEPLAVSEPSDSDGRYLLRLPEPATVFLRAREHYGRRSPADGGYMGVYGGGDAIPVVVDTRGDKQARDLTVILVPPLIDRQNKASSNPSPP